MTTCMSFLLAMIVASPPLVPPDARVEQVATGFRFTEGPALAPDGSIYFSDIPNDCIHRYDPATSEISTVHENTGGANGLMFDAKGDLIACCGKRRAVVRYPKDGGEPVVLAELYQGKRLNSPNDLAIDKAGNIWFTDPRYGKRDNMVLDHESVYRIGADDVQEVYFDKAAKPNGIAFSPTPFAPFGQSLIIADNAGKRLLQMSLHTGTTTALASVEGPGGPDGMTVDRAGNVYAAWHGGGGVHVWSAAGEHIGIIATPEEPTNCTFAADGHTLYITAGKSLYRVVLNVP